MPPVYDLNEKVALVTGGARGIGFETARQIHQRGGSVAIVDLNAEQAGEAAKQIGPRALGLAANVTDDAAIRQAVAETVDRFGGLDVAVANAGTVQAKVATVRGISTEEWERVFEVDFLGVWRTVRAALPQIVERRGHVAFTISIYSWLNGALNTPYAAAKAAVESFGRALRAELTPLGASATVAYFGGVDTKLLEDSNGRPHADRLEEHTPNFFLAKISPEEAATVLVRGIERRSPRVFAPRRWRYISAFRGILNPVFDRGIERDSVMTETVREIEAETDERGAAAVNAVTD